MNGISIDFLKLRNESECIRDMHAEICVVILFCAQAHKWAHTHITRYKPTNIICGTYGGVMTTDDCVELTPNDDKQAFAAVPFFQMRASSHHEFAFIWLYNFIKRMLFVDGVLAVYLLLREFTQRGRRIFDIENNWSNRRTARNSIRFTADRLWNGKSRQKTETLTISYRFSLLYLCVHCTLYK